MTVTFSKYVGLGATTCTGFATVICLTHRLYFPNRFEMYARYLPSGEIAAIITSPVDVRLSMLGLAKPFVANPCRNIPAQCITANTASASNTTITAGPTHFREIFGLSSNPLATLALPVPPAPATLLVEPLPTAASVPA